MHHPCVGDRDGLQLRLRVAFKITSISTCTINHLSSGPKRVLLYPAGTGTRYFLGWKFNNPS